MNSSNEVTSKDTKCPPAYISKEDAVKIAKVIGEPVGVMGVGGHVMSKREYERHQAPDKVWVIEEHWTPNTPLYAIKPIADESAREELPND